MGINDQNGFFLEVTLVRLINIFTLNLEIVPAVWGFIFVSIVEYIRLSPPMYVRVMLYICLFYMFMCVKCDVMILLYWFLLLE